MVKKSFAARSRKSLAVNAGFLLFGWSAGIRFETVLIDGSQNSVARPVCARLQLSPTSSKLKGLLG
jgi:hypothetical protein